MRSDPGDGAAAMGAASSPGLPPIVIDEAFARAGLRPALGCLVAEVSVSPAGPALAGALDAAMRRLSDRCEDIPPSKLPAIDATRRAFRALGKDPSRYRPAAEALARRVLQGKGLHRVNNIVDLNNLVSLETGLSIGAYDLARLRPPLSFRPGQAGESYEGIGRGAISLENLPVLSDGEGPFGSPVSDSRRSSISGNTRHLLMVLMGFGDAAPTVATLAMAASHLAELAGARIAGRQIVGDHPCVS